MRNAQTEIKYIPIEAIKPNPYQPRKTFNKKSLVELSQSIKTYGLIQPISVRKIHKKSYELVAGERRLRASKMANLKKVPVIVLDYRDVDSAMVALIENLQRENLNFIEEAEGYANLIKDHGFTQGELAEKLGKSQSTIANKLRILKLPDIIKRTIIDTNLTERHARALLRIPSDESKLEALEKIIEEDLTVKRTERLVDNILDKMIMDKGQEDGKNQKVKGSINLRIYLNTLKNAYNEIKKSGLDASYSENNEEEFVEVVVRIPKTMNKEDE